MIKYVKYIFISFLCILLMSHNTFAYDLTRDVQLQGNSTFTFQVVTADPSNYSMLDNNKCIRATGITGISVFNVVFNNSINVQAGDYLQVWFSVGINAENNSSDTMIRGLQLGTAYGYLDLIQMDYEEVNPSNGVVRITFRSNNTASVSRLTFLAQNAMLVLYNNEYIYAGSVTNWRPIANTFSSQDIVNAINNQTDYSQELNTINNSIQQQQQNEQEAIDNIDNQSPDDIDTGDSAGATSILGALSGFFTTLKNTSATNCLITGDLGHIDMGQLNLCQGKEHFASLFNFIGYSCLFVVVFWASYSLVKRILGLIDWYRGK